MNNSTQSAKNSTKYSSTYRRKTKRVSSRLAKKEENQVKKQTVWIIISTLVLLFFFVFILMPGAIKLFFGALDSGSSFDNSDTIPPQIPVLSSPVNATNTSSFVLSGFAEPESEVRIVMTGEQVAAIKVDDAGVFSHEIGLSEGDNVFILYSVDEACNESAETKSYSILMDSEDPTINIESPENDAHYELRKNQLLHIKGTTEPSAKVYINGRLVIAKSDGAFSNTFQMNEGENKLLFKIEDKAGNTVEKELIVHFKF